MVISSGDNDLTGRRFTVYAGVHGQSTQSLHNKHTYRIVLLYVSDPIHDQTSQVLKESDQKSRCFLVVPRVVDHSHRRNQLDG
jgi:hypothetical protein